MFDFLRVTYILYTYIKFVHCKYLRVLVFIKNFQTSSALFIKTSFLFYILGVDTDGVGWISDHKRSSYRSTLSDMKLNSIQNICT